MADGYLTFDTKLNTSGFQKGIGSISSMFGKLGAIAAAALSVAAITNFGKASVQAASQMEAKFKGLQFLMNANNRSMQDATSFIQEYTADGLVPMTSAYEAYKNMVSRGYDTSQIEQMMNVMKDAAVYNRQGQFTMGQAIEKATMGLRMENSLLTDSVGIQKNVAKMWQEYAKEIGTTANNLTLAQKRQAEFNGFMREGGVFAGAAAEYTNSYAGRTAALSASFLNLKVAVGNAIVPVLNAIIPAVSQVVLWFTKLFNIVGQVMNLLFGTAVGMADAEAAMADNAEATAAAMEDTAANTEAAGKAAKGALASFDKLNVLSQDTAGGGAGAGSGGGLLPPVEQPGGESLADKLGEESKKIQEFVNGIKSIFEPLMAAFSRLGAALGRVGEAVTGAFKLFFPNGINFMPFIENVRNGVVFVIDLLAKAVEGFATWIEENPDAFMLLATIFAGIAIAALAVYAPTVLIIAAVLALLAAIGWLATNWDLVKEKALEAWGKIEEAWNIAAKWFNDNVTEPIKTFFSDAWTNISGFFTGAWDDIKKTWTTVSTWFYDNVTEPVKTFFSDAWTEIKGFFTGAWDDIQLTWNTVSTWFYDNVTEPVKGFFSDAWGSISGFVTGAWDDAKLVWNTVSQWFTDNVIDPVKTAFDTAFQEIKGFVESPFTNLGEFVKGVFNDVINFLNGLLTGLTSGINSVINALNGISFTIPDWVPLFGGNSFGVSLPNVSAPQIPLLATGAVIPPNAPFMAVVGDQRSGTNIEAPEALIRQIVREEVGGMGNQNITITFGGTMGELVRQLKPHIERENSRVGNTMLAQAVRVS